jgi:hypothetical protein
VSLAVFAASIRSYLPLAGISRAGFVTDAENESGRSGFVRSENRQYILAALRPYTM